MKGREEPPNQSREGYSLSIGQSGPLRFGERKVAHDALPVTLTRLGKRRDAAKAPLDLVEGVRPEEQRDFLAPRRCSSSRCRTVCSCSITIGAVRSRSRCIGIGSNAKARCWESGLGGKSDATVASVAASTV